MKANIEKLTQDKVYLNSILFGINCNFPPCCGEERTKEVTTFLGKVFDRLAELEDKLEQGLMIELPCKMNEKLWFIVTKYKGRKNEYSFVKQGWFSQGNYFNILENFGKTVFLTESEAQAELERRNL